MKTNPSVCSFEPLSDRTDNWTRQLLVSIARRDACGARIALESGGNPHLEFDRIDLVVEWSVQCGTAMTLATISDSLAGQPLMVKVLLDGGARIDQIDSRGRGLLDFATGPAVIRFLQEEGAPPATALDAWN